MRYNFRTAESRNPPKELLTKSHGGNHFVHRAITSSVFLRRQFHLMNGILKHVALEVPPRGPLMSRKYVHHRMEIDVTILAGHFVPLISRDAI